MLASEKPYFFPQSPLLIQYDPNKPNPLRKRFPAINTHPCLKLLSDSYLSCFKEEKLRAVLKNPKAKLINHTYKDIKTNYTSIWVHHEAETALGTLAAFTQEQYKINVLGLARRFSRKPIDKKITLQQLLIRPVYHELNIQISQLCVHHVWHLVIYLMLGYSCQDFERLRGRVTLPDISLTPEAFNHEIVPREEMIDYRFVPQREQVLANINRRKAIKATNAFWNSSFNHKQRVDDYFFRIRVARFASLALEIPINEVTEEQIDEHQEPYRESVIDRLVQGQERRRVVPKREQKDDDVVEEMAVALLPPSPALVPSFFPLIPKVSQVESEVARISHPDLLIKVTLKPRMLRWFSENCDPSQFEDRVGDVYVKLYENRAPEELFFLQQAHKLIGIDQLLSSPYLVRRYGTRYSKPNQDGEIKQGIFFLSESTLPALVKNADGTLERTFITVLGSICVGIEGDIFFLFDDATELAAGKVTPKAFHGMLHADEEYESPTLTDFLQTLPTSEVTVHELFEIKARASFEPEGDDLLWNIGSKAKNRITHRLLLP